MYSISAEISEQSSPTKYPHESGAALGQESREAEELPSLEIFKTQLYMVLSNFDQDIKLDDLPSNLNYSAAL